MASQYRKYKDLGETKSANLPQQMSRSVQKPVIDNKSMSLRIPSSTTTEMYTSQATQPLDTQQRSVLHLTDKAMKEKAINTNRIFITKIFADWCEPCKMIAPAYEEMATKYNRPGICLLATEDISDKLSDSIRGVPTFHLYRDGVLVDTIVGADLTTDEGVEAKLMGIIESLKNLNK